jgi:hypothetical protein
VVIDYALIALLFFSFSYISAAVLDGLVFVLSLVVYCKRQRAKRLANEVTKSYPDTSNLSDYRKWFLLFNMISRAVMLAAYVIVLTSTFPYYARLTLSSVQFLYIGTVFTIAFAAFRNYKFGDFAGGPGRVADVKDDDSESSSGSIGVQTSKYQHLVPMRRGVGGADRSPRVVGSRRSLASLFGSEEITERLPLNPTHFNWGRRL